MQSIAPRRLINEWALTGEPFDAGTAQAAGLLNYVVPATELDAKIDWLIGRIADKSPTAIRRGKYAMRAIASMSFDESIAYTESQIALAGDDGGRQGRPQGLWRKAQAVLAGEVIDQFRIATTASSSLRTQGPIRRAVDVARRCERASLNQLASASD